MVGSRCGRGTSGSAGWLHSQGGPHSVAGPGGQHVTAGWCVWVGGGPHCVCWVGPAGELRQPRRPHPGLGSGCTLPAGPRPPPPRPAPFRPAPPRPSPSIPILLMEGSHPLPQPVGSLGQDLTHGRRVPMRVYGGEQEGHVGPAGAAGPRPRGAAWRGEG